jgi:hypothetical protein
MQRRKKMENIVFCTNNIVSALETKWQGWRRRNKKRFLSEEWKLCIIKIRQEAVKGCRRIPEERNIVKDGQKAHVSTKGSVRLFLFY